MTSWTGGNVSVVPQDAVPLLRAGKLDPRLFEVTELIRSGYDDTARKSLPLLVTYGRAGDRRTAAGIAGVRVVADLPAVNGAALDAPKARIGEVWASVTRTRAGVRSQTAGGVDRIWLDGRRDLSLEHSVPQIGAPAAHQAGFTGRGVRVAVLDSGVDDDHPDLNVAETRNFSDAPDARDTVGHGTHVASIIAGSGAASGGKYRGVAPGATLLSGKVCGDFCQESAILAGMHWAAVEKRATVVNLSLGGRDRPGLDPLEEAINTLTAQTGTLFVVAAGNNEFSPVSSPSSADAALSVGAVDREDRLAAFSSTGPRVGDGGIKPDITAPGVDIAAARAAGTLLGIPMAGDKYVQASGTSMASPHVAGAVALLAQQHPDWTAGQLKGTLMGSAAPQPGQTVYQQGAGRVDVARAVAQTVVSEPASIMFGKASWPHHDDEPVRRTVAYRNHGPTAVTLELAAEVTGPDGEPAPAGMFTLAADRVTVPAGGRAEVAVTADTTVDGADGLFAGRIVARAGATVLSTPVAVEKEVETFTVRVTHLDRSGARTPNHATDLARLDGNMPSWISVDDPDADGVAEVRVPKGRYGLHSRLWDVNGDGDQDTSAQIVKPELLVTGDTTLTVDARRAGPVKVTVPEASAAPVLAQTTAIFSGERVGYGISSDHTSYAGHFIGQIGPAVPADRFVSWVDSQWTDPDVPATPYLYVLSETIPGSLPNGFTRTYDRSDLATVRNEFRGETGLAGVRTVFPAKEMSSGAPVPVTVPGTLVEFHNTNETGRVSNTAIGVPTEDGWLDKAIFLDSRPTTYQAGRQYRDAWNSAPYAPTLATRWPDQGIVRRGDYIEIDIPLHADHAGHPGISSSLDDARTALYRNGHLVGEYTGPGWNAWGTFLVPPDAARYRLETSAKRSFTDLSTEVSASWTFPSQRTDGNGTTKPPASTVRFTPTLDTNNAAPAGQVFDIPVRVEPQSGAPAAPVRTLTVQISYDAGRTWKNATLRPDGSAWTATVTHPTGTGHASLRATATDTNGNTVTQTVIQAYRLR
ncbi:S8 family serine peptidase [Plantactinospora mayteni]|uniref:Serine protease n=1 Tax=Plantactinospora mayteni TaxID=566021 RepID=A0ABQ4ESH2_9ACTN|nr:serine protease [Plantactinospora mayteni]